jgi:hypothetical protein
MVSNFKPEVKGKQKNISSASRPNITRLYVKLPSEIYIGLDSKNPRRRRNALIDRYILDRIRGKGWQERYQDRFGNWKEELMQTGEVMVNRSAITRDLQSDYPELKLTSEHVRCRIERLKSEGKLVYSRSLQAHNGIIYKANFIDYSKENTEISPNRESENPQLWRESPPTAAENNLLDDSKENTTKTPNCKSLKPPIVERKNPQPIISYKLDYRDKII